MKFAKNDDVYVIAVMNVIIGEKSNSFFVHGPIFSRKIIKTSKVELRFQKRKKKFGQEESKGFDRQVFDNVVEIFQLIKENSLGVSDRQ